MKQIQRLIVLLITLCTLTGCHKDQDDYYAQVTTVLTANDDIQIQAMQGTVTLYNISNKQSYASSALQGTSVNLQVLKGAYSITAEGTCRYTKADGKTYTAHFRAVTDYVEIIDSQTLISTPLILMNL